MKKRVCDICGAEVEHSLLSETLKIKIWDSGIRKLDICSKCARKIRMFCKLEREANKYESKEK